MASASAREAIQFSVSVQLKLRLFLQEVGKDAIAVTVDDINRVFSHERERAEAIRLTNLARRNKKLDSLPGGEEYFA